MRFFQPELLYLLILPIALLIGTLYRTQVQRKALKKFGETELVRALMPDLSLRRKLVKDLILIMSLSLMILALARPQMGSKTEKVKLEGVELMVLLDISNSMRATDATPSRLVMAKNIISKMFDQLDNNKIGLIYFAGDAFVQMPLSADYISAKMFLDNADPSLIEAQGTEIGKAVHLAMSSFSSDEKTKKSIVIITDGEDHDGSALQEVEAAKKAGIQISVIGVGSIQGAPIKMSDGSYLKDERGEMVVTKLNPEIGKEIATTAEGVFIHAQEVTGSVKALRKSIDKLDKEELESTIYSAYNEVYAYFLIPALILLILEFVILDRKNRYIESMKLFDARTHE